MSSKIYKRRAPHFAFGEHQVEVGSTTTRNSPLKGGPLDCNEVGASESLVHSTIFYRRPQMVDLEKMGKLSGDELAVYLDSVVQYWERRLAEMQGIVKNLLEVKSLESKYSIGQEVWRINDEYEPESFVIRSIIKTKDAPLFLDDHGRSWISEQLFESKKELIEDQVNYWLSMLEMPEQIRFFANQAKDMCEHDWQVAHEPLMYVSTNPQMQVARNILTCKKCGEFYK